MPSPVTSSTGASYWPPVKAGSTKEIDLPSEMPQEEPVEGEGATAVIRTNSLFSRCTG